jgi:hypothetical protein
MAWQMNYTDPVFGENYPKSYWNIAESNTQPRPSKTGNIVFRGYADASQNGKRVIGQKVYRIDSATYTTLVQQPLPGSFPANVTTPEAIVASLLYAYSMTTQDIAAKDGTPTSFFGGAIAV